jgi:hypothetical protein
VIDRLTYVPLVHLDGEIGMKIFAAMFASLFTTMAIAVPASSQMASRTWITDVTIISPEDLDHIEKGSVLIENGRIVSVERKKKGEKARWRDGGLR